MAAINLTKGQKIDLTKGDGSKLASFCVGANWGMIEKKGIFGGGKKIDVDLDLSVGMFDADNNLVDKVYFRNLSAQGIQHSGDDTGGDADGDDGLDNEVVTVTLAAIPEKVEKVVFILNSFQHQDFATIPFAAIRLYEGTPDRVDEVVANFNIASDPKFSGFVSMILGKLYRRNGEWKFASIGEPTKDKDLDATLRTSKAYL